MNTGRWSLEVSMFRSPMFSICIDRNRALVYRNPIASFVGDTVSISCGAISMQDADELERKCHGHVTQCSLSAGSARDPLPEHLLGAQFGSLTHI